MRSGFRMQIIVDDSRFTKKIPVVFCGVTTKGLQVMHDLSFLQLDRGEKGQILYGAGEISTSDLKLPVYKHIESGTANPVSR